MTSADLATGSAPGRPHNGAVLFREGRPVRMVPHAFFSSQLSGADADP